MNAGSRSCCRRRNCRRTLSPSRHSGIQRNPVSVPLPDGALYSGNSRRLPAAEATPSAPAFSPESRGSYPFQLLCRIRFPFPSTRFADTSPPRPDTHFQSGMRIRSHSAAYHNSFKKQEIAYCFSRQIQVLKNNPKLL